MTALDSVPPLADMRDANALIGDGRALLERLQADGYLLLRRLVPAAEVKSVRAGVIGCLDNAGWLDRPVDVDAPRPNASAVREEADLDPRFFDAYGAIQRLQAFHDLAHHPSLIDLMGTLVPSPLLVHPRKIARIGLPRDPMVAPPHQDFPLNQGSADVLTAWIPLGDCPTELGGLRVLTGSHRRGLQQVRPVPGVGGLQVPAELEDEPGWVSANFAAGDVLVFHSLTVHAALANHTDRLRLSVDFRYQSATEPVVEGSLLPHYFPLVPGHDELASDWTSRRAVDVPPGLILADPFDPYRGPPEPPAPRLVTIG